MSLSVTRPARTRAQFIVACGIAALSLPPAAPAQHTQRVGVGPSGEQANDATDQLSLSADGRFVAFGSGATNFAPGDVNSYDDVYLRDRLLGTTTWISAGMGGAPGTGASFNPTISATGRFVVFDSYASNLVPGDVGNLPDVFLWDSQVGTLEMISVPMVSGPLHWGQAPSVSADGRYVAFTSGSPDMVPGDTNGVRDVFVRDRQLGTTERISVGPGGVEGDGEAIFDWTWMSADGRFVVFTSSATNMVPGDTNGKQDVFLRDLLLDTTEIMSVDMVGGLGDGHCSTPTISTDGRYVAFGSASTNLVPGDTNGVEDIFLRDRQLGTIERVSLDSSGSEADGPCSLGFYPQISGDGRFVAFSGTATNLVPGDTNTASDAFLRDRLSGTTERLSLSSAQTEGSGGSYYAAISSDGRLASFVSYASNLVVGDTNHESDVFVRDRDATAFVAFCEPGTGGVIPCPCANPPSGAGRGCDNFGAGPIDSGTLTATGAAYVGDDSVVLQASGENNSSLTVFFAGTATVPGGAVLGAGVRCVGGSLKRLYTGSASGGIVARPGLGDPSVSARSAAAGAPIAAGDTRYYFGAYRDPLAAGPCGSSASTVNTTSAGSITWSL